MNVIEQSIKITLSLKHSVFGISRQFEGKVICALALQYIQKNSDIDVLWL